MVADLAVHLARGSDGRPQLHAHILLTLRRISPEGGFGPKARDWNDPSVLACWRERWASLANARLAACDRDVRIDHRSLSAQGVALIPQKKIGPVAGGRRMAEIQENSGPAVMHREIARANGARIIARPALALDAITTQQATFTRPDLLRLLHRHTDGAAQFAQALARVEASPDLVRLGRDGRGQERFTTRGMLACERDLAADGASLAAGCGHPTVSEARIGEAAKTAGLGDEQAQALRHITTSADIALIVGFAGTGKSTLLGTARDIWEAAGYRVRGVALSGIAADGLQRGAGITSRTIASQMLAWRRGRERPRANDILVDEAGMVGSRDMQALLAAAKAAGAKVVLVGDAEQLQPIAAGAPFRLLVERLGAAVIKTVRRQREAWQQQATEELATANTGAALARYMAAGRVWAHDAIEAAKSALIAEWAEERRSAPGAKAPQPTRPVVKGPPAVKARPSSMLKPVAPAVEATRPPLPASSPVTRGCSPCCASSEERPRPTHRQGAKAHAAAPPRTGASVSNGASARARVVRAPHGHVTRGGAVQLSRGALCHHLAVASFAA